MNAPAAIQATFADFRLVKGRKVCQLVVELPIERADEALRVLGGIPRPDAERWVALARLNETSEATQVPAGAAGASDQGGEDLGRESSPPASRAWADIRPAQQAGMRCREPEFQSFLSGIVRKDIRNTDEAADALRAYLGVKTRYELATNHKALVLWHQLDKRYLVATGRLAAHG